MRRFISLILVVVMVVVLLVGLSQRLSAANLERVGPPCSTCLPCLPTGMWNAAPWTTPFTPSCQPWFAAGVVLDLSLDAPMTVVRLQPIPTGKPKEPPPPRFITSEPVRPPRPRVDIDEPRPNDPPDMPKGSLSKLHVILLADNEANDTGKTNAAGAELILQLVKNGIRPERLAAVARLDTADLTPDSVTRKLQDVPVKADDTLLVYYSGAAEYDEAGTTVTLTPKVGMAKMPRDELKKMALAKGARLTILLTDPAARPTIAEPTKKAETPDPGPGGLEKLFFATQGIVDLHGCSAGEFAAARGNYGGCFTQAFVREFGRPAGTWADMLESVKFSTNNLFKSYRLEVLKSDDLQPPAKAPYRNQESQIPAPLTPVDNLKPAAPVGGGAAPVNGAQEPILSNILVQQEERQSAKIYLRVPERAIVFIDGQLTAQTGVERGYETPPLSMTQTQNYEVRMEVQGWAGVYRIEVRGGKTVMAELQVPETVAVSR